MTIEAFLRDRRSRRSLFHAAGVSMLGASAVFLGACGNGGGATGAAPAGGSGEEVAILNSALDLEHLAVAAYIAGAPLLGGDTRRLASRLLAHEQQHADALARTIRDLGGTPHAPRSSYDLPELDGPSDVLRLANDLEHTAVAAYLDALPRLSSPDLRATAAAIVTTEAEHVAVLLGALGRPQVPSAFVTGERRAR